MTPRVFHPGLFELLRLQSRGRRRRFRHRLVEPRRLVLTLLAGLLAIVWLGNAALTVWLREAASPDTLRALLSSGLVFYATWHIAKAAFFRPETPFEWSPAESDLLAAMPLTPRDLVSYQVASVTVTTILKAALFVVLLLPDLRSLPLGFAGLLLAMLALEMLRMGVDIAAWGMGRATYLAYRVTVVAGLVAGGFAIGSAVMREHTFARINLGDGLLERLLDILVQLNASVFVYVALPFRPFIDLILAESFTVATLQVAAVSAGAVMAMAVAVIGLYSFIAGRVAVRERRNYTPTTSAVANAASTKESSATNNSATPTSQRPIVQIIPSCRGAGALVWRQLVGARRNWGSLLTAMIAPAILAAAPCFVIANANIAFLATTATLAFYTFLLLPTALRFDFRRDFERLATLKGLPIAPTAAVLGQTLAPVVIATVFQAVVLAFAIVARSLPPYHLATAVLVMIPLNLLVFALDNLIYLLYPHRVQQEGLEIFLRTMLTFTGKGLLFAAALAVMTAWGFMAADLTRAASAWTGRSLDAHAVFAAGMIVGPFCVALVTLNALARTYRHLDPVEDVPR
jgi:hypothetical protein